jgi:pyridinium-3,5-biscarboxylic acid mononucleotide synthase
MKETILRKIEGLKSGAISAAEFIRFIEHFPFSSDADIKLDFHRTLRRGLPEAIYGESKSVDQLALIVKRFLDIGETMLITRVSADKFAALAPRFPALRYHAAARIITTDVEPKPQYTGTVLVLSAGASDEGVAEEARISAQYLGNPVEREYDVGVACMARILSLREQLNRCAVIIAVAGMEGALPSVVAGLTQTPVIAVPTSIGYGASFHGVSALLSMLNACAGGISVVNIDNGFGAAYQATLFNQKITRASRPEEK